MDLRMRCLRVAGVAALLRVFEDSRRKKIFVNSQLLSRTSQCGVFLELLRLEPMPDSSSVQPCMLRVLGRLLRKSSVFTERYGARE